MINKNSGLKKIIVCVLIMTVGVCTISCKSDNNTSYDSGKINGPEDIEYGNINGENCVSNGVFVIDKDGNILKEVNSTFYVETLDRPISTYESQSAYVFFDTFPTTVHLNKGEQIAVKGEAIKDFNGRYNILTYLGYGSSYLLQEMQTYVDKGFSDFESIAGITGEDIDYELMYSDSHTDLEEENGERKIIDGFSTDVYELDILDDLFGEAGLHTLYFSGNYISNCLLYSDLETTVNIAKYKDTELQNNDIKLTEKVYILFDEEDSTDFELPGEEFKKTDKGYFILNLDGFDKGTYSFSSLDSTKYIIEIDR